MRYLPISLATLLLATSLPAFAQPAPLPTQPAPPPPYAAPPYAPGPMPMLPPPMEPKRRSTGMMVAGIVLTSIASAALVGGIVTTALFASTSSNASGIGFVVISLPLLGGSTIFAGVGIPLWIVGASTPKPRYAEAIPRLSVGAGSGALRWTF